MQPTPQQLIMQLGSGYWAAQTLSVATRLDLLEGLSQGPTPAAQLGFHTPSVVRLLRGCAALGMTEESQPEVFALTPAGQFLLASHPQSLKDAVIMMTDPGHWNSWTQLEHTVRTGQAAYQVALGVDNVFDYFSQHPDEAARFDKAMASMTRAFVGGIREAFNFSNYACIADIGGGRGQLLGAILQLAPQSRGVLFDQAAVVEAADPELQALGVQDRVTKVAGNFFEEAPLGADLYLLKHILHDWTEAQCATILGQLHRAMQPDQHLLVIEMLLPEPPRTGEAAMMDLNMMVMTGGRERTLSHYKALLQAAGFRFLDCIQGQGPHQMVWASR